MLRMSTGGEEIYRYLFRGETLSVLIFNFLQIVGGVGIAVLCKVWRRRVEHPYTAHIAPQSHPPIPSTESCLRKGEDYNNTDYEYDSDEEEDYDQLPPRGLNKTITEEVLPICQSISDILLHHIVLRISSTMFPR